jgi:hypothetical protein
MDTDTQTPIFYCTEFVTWPAPEIGNERYKGKPTPVCWQQFDSIQARIDHYHAAHQNYLDVCSPAGLAVLLGTPMPERVIEEFVPSNMAGPSVDPVETEYHVPSTIKADTAVTEKQLLFIVSLAARKGIEPNEVTTKAEASIEIDRLNAHPDKDSFRRNQYDGTCVTCGGPVAAYEGMIVKDGRWLTYHLSCPDEAQTVADVSNGYYAISSKAGHTSFYSVTAGRNPGVMFVDLLVGGGPNGTFARQSVPRKNQAAVLGEIEKAGVEAAAKRFGQETGKCYVCNRGLTNKESRDAGIGPECSKK